MKCSCRPWRVMVLALAALVLGTALNACRTPVAVEGDLGPQPFLTARASLVKDAAGNWYAVAARGDEPRAFLSAEYGGTTHLFLTIPQGERSAQILPLSRVDIDWFNDAADGAPTLVFHDEIEEVDLESTVGIWAGGDDDHIRWLGPVPDEPLRGVVLPGTGRADSVSLPERVVGTVDAAAEGVIVRHGSFAADGGPYVILPDGPISDAGPIAASMVDFPFEPEDLPNWNWNIIDGPTVSNNAELQELTGRHSVEILVTGQDDGTWRIGFAPDGSIPHRGSWRRPAALVETGLIVESDAEADALEAVLRGLDALYRDHLLSAAYYLERAGPGRHWRVGQQELATLLRHQDLVAAGGFVSWMRAAATENAEGIGPELSLFLARAFAYEEHWPAVEVYINRALNLFSNWPRRPGALGTGSAHLLDGELNFQRGEYGTAVDAFRSARDDFQSIEDTYRAALAERAALLVIGEGNFDFVVDVLLEVGARHEASRTRLLAAARAIEERRFREGRRNLDMWTDRFAPEAGARLLLFFWALDQRLRSLQGEPIGSAELSRRMDEAIAGHAWEAAVLFGLTQHPRHAIHDDLVPQQLGELLVEATLRSQVPLFAREVDQTLGVICSHVVFSRGEQVGSALLQRECSRRIDQLIAHPEGVRFLLDGGYRFIQRGELRAAESLEEFITQHLADTEDWAIARGETALFRASLLQELSDPDAVGEADEEILLSTQEAFDELRQALSPGEAPAHLQQVAEEFEARSMDRLATDLYSASIQAAAQADQSSQRYQASLALAETAHRAKRWRLLAEIDNVDSPLHAARIDLYKAHAAYELDNRGLGRELEEQGLDRAREFGDFQRISVLHLASRLAFERHDTELARQYVDRGLEILEALPDSLAAREERRVLEARIRALKARLLAMQERRSDAGEQALRARQIFGELPRKTAPHVRREVYEAGLVVDTDRGEFESVLDRLRTLNRALSDDTPLIVRRDVARTLVQYLIASGRNEDANDTALGLVSQGLGFGQNRVDHHCRLGEARLFGGDTKMARFHLRRCTGGDRENRAAARASLLMAMADGEATPSYRAGVARHLFEQLPPALVGERTRVEWIAELPVATAAVPPAIRAELQRQYEAAADPSEAMEPSRRINATVNYIEHLLSTERFSEADRILESEPEIFFDPQLEARDQWVLLRLKSMVYQLRPFEFFEYSKQVIDESPLQSEQSSAEMYYYAAMAHFQLGQYFPALHKLDEARRIVDPQSDLAAAMDELESTVAASRFGQ